jgi:uncharacterized membrane-anchored protein YjiN (DUF445 family)
MIMYCVIKDMNSADRIPYKDKENMFKSYEDSNMKNKPNKKKLKEIDRLYKPSKEELTKSIIETIKEFEEGHVILSSKE